MLFSEVFCVYKDDYVKFERLVQQYGVVIVEIRQDGWTNGRFLYITVESVDEGAWFPFLKDAEATLDRHHSEVG